MKIVSYKTAQKNVRDRKWQQVGTVHHLGEDYIVYNDKINCTTRHSTLGAK